MPASTTQAPQPQDTQQRIKIRDLFMAGASILGPITGTVVGILFTRGTHTTPTDPNHPHWKPDAGEWILVGLIVLAISVSVWLWIRRKLEQITEFRSELAAKESKFTICVNETVELRNSLSTKDRQLAKSDKEIKELRSATVATEQKLTQSTRECVELRAALQDRERDLESAAAIRMIHPAEYMDILRKLAETHGPGHLLLFNIELNTFGDDAVFERLWGRLAEVSEIKSVRMALPQHKFRRWETVVTGVREDFFNAEKNGRKFIACKYTQNGHNPDDRIAFALYDCIREPHRRDWGALFLLNRPFVEGRADGTHDYLHVLEYRGSHEVLSRCRTLWGTVYESDWAETAEEIQRFHRQLRNPPELKELLAQHHCDQARRDRIIRVVGSRRVAQHDGRTPQPRDLPSCTAGPDGSLSFRVPYRHVPPVAEADEVVKGVCVGLKRGDTVQKLPCIVWSSGFGEGQEPRLARILSKKLNGSVIDAIEIFFEKSGSIEEATCTRVEEDIRSVVDYAAEIPVVDRNRLCVIGISLSAYLAARVARDDHRIRSLVLVAPPFDIVEMLDNFRRHYLAGRPRIPTFFDFLKARNNLKIADWDRNPKYCNYFNHIVTSCHLADIAVKGISNFGRQGFLDSLTAITRTGRRVALIYGEDDPIVRAPENMQHLNAEIEKGFIKEDNLFLSPISVAHYYPKQGTARKYPLRMPENDPGKAALISEMSDAIRHCLNLVTDPDGSGSDTGDDSGQPQLRIKAG